MKSLKKQRRIQILAVSAIALILASALIGYGFQGSINLYRAPTQVIEDPPRDGEIFRLGGLIEEGSLVRGQENAVSFIVTDNVQNVPVRFTGIMPDLIAEGQGVVATGKMAGDTFIASEILAKHDEQYMPREVIDSLKESGEYVAPNS